MGGRAFQPMKASLPLADSNLTKAHGASLNTTAASKGGKGQQPKKKEEPKKKEAPKPKVVEDDPEAEPKEKKVVLTEAEKEAGNKFFDYKTLYANATDKAAAVDQLFAQWDSDFEGYFSVWTCLYDKLPRECKDEIKTNNMMSFFFRGLDGTNKDMLAVHGMYGEPNDHDLKGVWMWRGTEYNAKLADHSSAEYYNFTKMDMSKQENRDKLKECWTNTTAGEGSYGGQKVLNVKVWK